MSWYQELETEDINDDCLDTHRRCTPAAQQISVSSWCLHRWSRDNRKVVEVVSHNPLHLFKAKTEVCRSCLNGSTYLIQRGGAENGQTCPLGYPNSLNDTRGKISTSNPVPIYQCRSIADANQSCQDLHDALEIYDFFFNAASPMYESPSATKPWHKSPLLPDPTQLTLHLALHEPTLLYMNYLVLVEPHMNNFWTRQCR